MDRGAYTAATGMMAQQTRLDVLANNLANVNTRGFKADRVAFEDYMQRAVSDDGGEGRVVGSLAAGPAAAVETTDFTPGAFESTGNPLDLRLEGDTVAMFGVRTPQGVRYTRNGEFRLDAKRQLATQACDPVLDDRGQPIVLDGTPEIAPNGQIRVNGKTVATLGRYVGAFTKDLRGGNLFASGDAKASAEVSVTAGALETANVEPVSLMTQMIALQRTYEMSQKMVQSQDESTAKLAETMG